MLQKLAAILGIGLAIAVIYLFFFTPWAVDYVNAGGNPDAGFGLQIITALRDQITNQQVSIEFWIYLLLPIGAFVLVMQVVFDAFIWEQNHILMALAAIILIISPLYFLYNYNALPEFDPLDGSKWDLLRNTYWISLAVAGVTTVFGLIYAFFDWREYVARRRSS